MHRKGVSDHMSEIAVCTKCLQRISEENNCNKTVGDWYKNYQRLLRIVLRLLRYLWCLALALGSTDVSNIFQHANEQSKHFQNVSNLFPSTKSFQCFVVWGPCAAGYTPPAAKNVRNIRGLRCLDVSSGSSKHTANKAKKTFGRIWKHVRKHFKNYHHWHIKNSFSFVFFVLSKRPEEGARHIRKDRSKQSSHRTHHSQEDKSPENEEKEKKKHEEKNKNNCFINNFLFPFTGKQFEMQKACCFSKTSTRLHLSTVLLCWPHLSGWTMEPDMAMLPPRLRVGASAAFSNRLQQSEEETKCRPQQSNSLHRNNEIVDLSRFQWHWNLCAAQKMWRESREVQNLLTWLQKNKHQTCDLQLSSTLQSCFDSYLQQIVKPKNILFHCICG